REVARDPLDFGVDDVTGDLDAHVLAGFVDVSELGFHLDGVHLHASRYGGHSFACRCLRSGSSRANAGERRSAKGGTRTPIPFRLPDPKSGASASSATFARFERHS